nr:helix-hairpin-helix domain-containing protein [Hydrogenovibrio kuenenii]
MFSAIVYASPVNINKASAEKIASSLTGVGSKKAEAIVAYRKAHGDFKHVADLTHVKGIGVKTLAKNEQDILLKDADEK